LVEWVVGGGWW